MKFFCKLLCIKKFKKVCLQAVADSPFNILCGTIIKCYESCFIEKNRTEQSRAEAEQSRAEQSMYFWIFSLTMFLSLYCTLYVLYSVQHAYCQVPRIIIMFYFYLKNCNFFAHLNGCPVVGDYHPEILDTRKEGHHHPTI